MTARTSRDVAASDPQPRLASRASPGLLAAALALSLPACGHTEQEWQWQLDKLTRAQGDLAAANAKLAQMASDPERKRPAEEVVPRGAQPASTEERERALSDYRARQKHLDAQRGRFDVLRKKLEEFRKMGLLVGVQKNRLVVTIPADQIFESARGDVLKKEGLKLLKKVAEVIKTDPGLVSRDFQVVGHTDNKKLQGGLFKDNVGLSAMRAREVVALLVAEGVPAQRLSAAGAGDNEPLAAGDTDEAKQKNRRIDLVIVPTPEETLDLKSIQGAAAVAAPSGP
jgi:chemotaxis protein MotB